MEFRIVVLLSVVAVVWGGEQDMRIEEGILRGLLADYTSEKWHVRPTTNTTVRVGLSMSAILGMDERVGALQAIYWLKMKWNDPRLSWTEGADSVRDITYPADHMWIPDIILWNGLNHDRPVDNNLIYPVVSANGDVIYIPPTTYTTKCVRTGSDDWDWECSLRFGSWVHNGDKLILAPWEDGPVKVEIDDYDEALYGWRVEAPETEGVIISYYDCCPEPYGHIDFTLRLKNLNGATSSAATMYSKNMWRPLLAVLVWIACQANK